MFESSESDEIYLTVRNGEAEMRIKGRQPIHAVKMLIQKAREWVRPAKRKCSSKEMERQRARVKPLLADKEFTFIHVSDDDCSIFFSNPGELMAFGMAASAGAQFIGESNNAMIAPGTIAGSKLNAEEKLCVIIADQIGKTSLQCVKECDEALEDEGKNRRSH